MNKLLNEIARCEHAHHCLTNKDTTHPCYKIVSSQHVEDISTFQVPEPWSGHIDKAKILFISSNPSIGEDKHYPTAKSADDYVSEYFAMRFGGGSLAWIQNGTRELKNDGTYKNIRFWSAVKARAKEVLGNNVCPGEHYALTEVVHCKSKKEIGVSEAQEFCSDLYLKKILSASPAPLIISLGVNAQKALESTFSISSTERLTDRIMVMGYERRIAFLPHPNARQIRTFRKLLTTEQLADLRAYMASKSAA